MVEDAYSFSGFAEISAYTAEVSGLPIFEVSYERDGLGRIVVENEVVDGQAKEYEYAYDPAGKLWQVEEDGLLVSEYSYDPNGNRLEHWASGTTTAGAYDDQDRLLSYGTTTYTYGGANGELAIATTGSDTTTYIYDARGNLRSVTLPDSTTIEYLVDGRNRQVGRKIDGVLERRWVYQDQLNPVAELDAAGAVVAEYIYATKPNVPDVIIAYSGGVPVATYRIISDHLGSVRLVLDSATGAIAQRLDYDEFGQVLADTNPGFQPFAFAGGLYDPVTGLVRFGARDCDARTGRWTAKDPGRFMTSDTHLYLYTENNPINNLDPSGYEIMSPSDSEGARFLSERIAAAHEAIAILRRNANEMVRRNIIEADKYYHCFANCEAARLGQATGDVAWLLSEFREIYQEHWRGDPRDECDADRAANAAGQRAGRRGANCHTSCVRFLP